MSDGTPMGLSVRLIFGGSQMHTFSSPTPLSRRDALLTPAELDALLFGNFPQVKAIRPLSGGVSSRPAALLQPAGELSSQVQSRLGMACGLSGR